MTVHGAKGLEANIVILADTCEIPERRKEPHVLAATVKHSLGHLSVPLWRVRSDKDPALIAELRDQARARAMAEYERLLYVAMTRARDRLYICGFHNRPEDALPPQCWYLRVAPVLRQIGKSRTDPEGRIIWFYEGVEPGTGEFPEDEEDEATFEPLPEWIDTLPAAAATDVPELKPSRRPAAHPQETINPPLRGGAGRDRARGVHIHRLLEALPGLDPAAREAAARRYLAMPGHGLDARGQEDILSSTVAVLDHGEFRDVFSPEGLAEVSIAAQVKLPDGREAAMAGRIDRLLVREHDVLVVDYKASRPPPRTLADIDPAYIRQLALYRLALASIYPQKTVRGAILWTESLKLMEVPAGLMDTALLACPP